MRREAVRKQCSGIFLLTKNVTDGLPGNHKTQLRESITALRTTPLDKAEREILETCRKELFKSGERDLGNLLLEACKESNSSPNLF